MKMSRAKQRRRGSYESLSASVSHKKNNVQYFKKSDQLVGKSPENIEEWDCPRPGIQKNNKIIKENKKRMEKNMRKALKKRIQTDSTETILPASTMY